MKNVFVAYDIRDDKRRNRLFKMLEGYGVAVQLSVFECVIKVDDLMRLAYRVQRIINHEEDSVLMMELCPRCHGRVRKLGRTREAHGGMTVIV